MASYAEQEREMKEIYHEVVRATGEVEGITEGKGASTSEDITDMYRMGKEQQFKVRLTVCVFVALD